MTTQITGLGEILIREGRITAADLAIALLEQKRTRERLGEILMRCGLVTESEVLDALAHQFGYRRYDPTLHEVQPAAAELVPVDFARRHNLLPIRADEERLWVAMNDPMDIEARDVLDRLAARTHRRVEVLLAPADVLMHAREVHYSLAEGSRNVRELIDQVVGEATESGAVIEDIDEQEAERRAQDASIISLVDQVISQALQERATDIHIEPQERGLVIRYRVDGMLYDALTPPRAVYLGAVSRIKILANMDIAERRAAQDGRLTFRGKGREVDIRVSCLPTIHGEKLVLRLLDKTNFNFSLADLGFSDSDSAALRKAIHQPYGMILLSGPTGSGKSTTLYSGLLEIRSEAVNILTVEDPVEYQIERINQVQVNERKKLTFATALRSFLRQDPDVIMVGEIRDRDTADIAVRAALTGHLVFSSIHANDAPATAIRLLSMGVEPFMAASALTVVAAQRLVRRNCRLCIERYRPADEILLALGEQADSESVFLRGRGCAACKGRGYQGRVAIVEMMRISPELRRRIAQNRPAGELRELACSEGMRTLRQDGMEKARAGLTTVEEILRVCLNDD